MQLNSNGYIIGFASAVCIVCSLFVSASAVALKEKQTLNQNFDLQKNVISVSALPEAQQLATITSEKVQLLFVSDQSKTHRIEEVYVELKTGQELESINQSELDADKTECVKAADSLPSKVNTAKLKCLPRFQKIYKVYKDGEFSRYILPVVGKGLWSTLKGFAAVDASGGQVVGLTFYSHGETPGLGGEIDSVSFKSQWAEGRTIYKDGEVGLLVRKGVAKDKKYEVNGLSGATLTGNGVSGMMSFWFGTHGYKTYLLGGV
jgi:Na+-transporting NADH:ubiquinone oxidoreductase subunit C